MRGDTATTELDPSVTESQFGEVSSLQFEELETFVDSTDGRSSGQVDSLGFYYQTTVDDAFGATYWPERDCNKTC